MKRRHSFSARLILNILIMTSVIFLVSLGIAAYRSITLITDEATKSAQYLLDKNIADIEKILSTIENSVNSNAWNVRENLDDSDFLYHITGRIVSESKNIVGSAIAFAPGYYPGHRYFAPYSYTRDGSDEILSKQLGHDDYVYFDMEWFSVPYKTKKPLWGEPYFDKGGVDQMVCTYSYPLIDEKGKVYAVMTADISLDWISQVQSEFKPGVVLLSSLGNILSSDSYVGDLGENLFTNFETVPVRSRNADNVLEAISRKERGIMEFSLKSEKAFVVFAPLSNSWVATVTCNYSDVLEGTSKILFFIFILGVFGIALLSFVCYRIIKDMSRPLAVFADSAKEIARGNFDAPLPQIKSDDEIGLLRDSFANMQSSLRNYIEELKTSTAENERFESELNIASKIQAAMLPRNFPTSDKFDLFACQRSAKEVGGDLYDFVVRGKYCYFAIGDVSGKGVPASLVMAATKAAFRLVASLHLTLDEMVCRINDLISENNEGRMFVTFFLGRLNIETGLVEYCNAGHNPPLITRKDGTVSKLDVKANITLGVFPGFAFESQNIRLSEGDRITLYTDGVTEAEKSDLSLYGEKRLFDLLSKIRKDSEEAVCSDIMDNVYAYLDGRPQNDDITVMSLSIIDNN